MAYGDYGEVVQLRGLRGFGPAGGAGIYLQTTWNTAASRAGGSAMPGAYVQLLGDRATAKALDEHQRPTGAVQQGDSVRAIADELEAMGAAPQRLTLWERIINPPGSYIALGAGALALVGLGWYFLKRR